MDLIQNQLAQKEKENKLRKQLQQSGIQSPMEMPPNYRRASLAPAMLDEAEEDDLLPRKDKQLSDILENDSPVCYKQRVRGSEQSCSPGSLRSCDQGTTPPSGATGPVPSNIRRP